MPLTFFWLRLPIFSHLLFQLFARNGNESPGEILKTLKFGWHFV